ncbi:MAG: tetratricopeptide repeat protein [Acidimicrobiia bacterium]
MRFDDLSERNTEALLAGGNISDANTLLYELVGLTPDDARAWCRLAHGLLVANELPQSLAAAARAVKIDARMEWSHRLAATTLLRLKNPVRALEEAQIAVKLAPNSQACRLVLADALSSVGERRYYTGVRQHRAARRHAQRAIEIDPKRADAHVVAALVEARAGMYGAAQSSARRALELDPNDFNSYRLLAFINEKIELAPPSTAWQAVGRRLASLADRTKNAITPPPVEYIHHTDESTAQ